MSVNPEKFSKIAELLGEDISCLSITDAAKKSVEAIRKLIQDLGLPQTLSSVGINYDEISELAKLAYQTRHHAFNDNPRDVQESDIESLFKAAL